MAFEVFHLVVLGSLSSLNLLTYRLLTWNQITLLLLQRPLCPAISTFVPVGLSTCRLLHRFYQFFNNQLKTLRKTSYHVLFQPILRARFFLNGLLSLIEYNSYMFHRLETFWRCKFLIDVVIFATFIVINVCHYFKRVTFKVIFFILNCLLF